MGDEAKQSDEFTPLPFGLSIGPETPRPMTGEPIAMVDASDEHRPDDLDRYEADISVAVARTAASYCWVLPDDYWISHHPYASKGRKFKGTYPGGRVWSDEKDAVLRVLWMTLIGTKP